MPTGGWDPLHAAEVGGRDLVSESRTPASWFAVNADSLSWVLAPNNPSLSPGRNIRSFIVLTFDLCFEKVVLRLP